MKLEVSAIPDELHGEKYIITDRQSNFVYVGHEQWSEKHNQAKRFERRSRATSMVEWRYKQRDDILKG